MSYEEFMDDGYDHYLIIKCDRCGHSDNKHDYAYLYVADGWQILKKDMWTGDAICPKCAAPNNVIIKLNIKIINRHAPV